MRYRMLTLIILLCSCSTSFAQHVEETYPKTLFCPNDTFYLRFGDDGDRYPFSVSANKSSPGTDANPNSKVTIFYGNDSLPLPYHGRVPYAHVIHIPFESPKGKSKLRFHYNALNAWFPDDYIAAATGQVRYDIPEVYELANIIWMLSPGGQQDDGLHKTGDYQARVMAHFKPYQSHAVFKKLRFSPKDKDYYQHYFDFRENSFAYRFQDTAAGAADCRLVARGPYYFVHGEEDFAEESLFGKLRPLAEDFAAKSGFRAFYQANRGYYLRETKRQSELMPVRAMWTWLEQEFPGRAFQSYRVVSSPLIGGSHSTQQYHTWPHGEPFGEAVMFICGTQSYDEADLAEDQKAGLMSGIVFTEIDHNYINPVSSRYQSRIDTALSNRGLWAKAGSSAEHYSDAMSVFNEYLTHAAFCVYTRERYDTATANYVIRSRDDLMVNRRGFHRFAEFNAELLRLRTANPGMPLVKLYPQMLAWCAAQR